jgi:peptidoglycan/xylan/chitin deacetylase (PgdA/CDA1 family)
VNAWENLVIGERTDALGADPRCRTESSHTQFQRDDRVGSRCEPGTAAAKRGTGATISHATKVGVSVLWYSGASLSRGLMRLAGRSPKPRFVVLYYHEVPEELRPCFARQMQALTRVATVVRAAHAGDFPDAGSYVAITFDDAFQSVRRNAVPELLSRGFPATIFVPVDYLGKKPGWDTEEEVEDQVMTSDELRSLPDLIELGSHSLSHAHLTRIDVARLSEEITKSRDKLSDLIGNRVSLLAFPYGEYDERVVGSCQQAGYERVFGIDPWLADPSGRDFVRGRVPVDPRDGPLLFYLKARGGYGWMIHASAVKRRLVRWRRSR